MNSTTLHFTHYKQYLEHPNLSQSNLLDKRVIFGLHVLLDGHQLSILSVAALEDNAITAFAYFRYLLVLLHNRSVVVSLRFPEQVQT